MGLAIEQKQTGSQFGFVVAKRLALIVYFEGSENKNYIYLL